MARVKKKLTDLIDNYGFSTAAIERIKKFSPPSTKTQLSLVLKGFAKFLLKAKSSYEKRWLQFDKVVIEDYYETKVQIIRPKPLSFHLPANVYTPDFMYILDNGDTLYIEVKGSEFQHGYRDSVAKLRMTATLFYFWKFAIAMPDKNGKNGWKIIPIEPDEEYGGLLLELYNQLESEKENL